MNFTDFGQNKINFLKTKLSIEVYSRLLEELEKYISPTKDLINAGDIYSAGEAIGVDIQRIEDEAENGDSLRNIDDEDYTFPLEENDETV
jgi:hypothetical protein